MFLAAGNREEGAVGGGFNDRDLRSKEGFLMGDFVVEDLVTVRCDIGKKGMSEPPGLREGKLNCGTRDIWHSGEVTVRPPGSLISIFLNQSRSDFSMR